MSGLASLVLHAHGPSSSPTIDGHLKVLGFSLAGLAIGDVEAPRLSFAPLVLASL